MQAQQTNAPGLGCVPSECSCHSAAVDVAVADSSVGPVVEDMGFVVAVAAPEEDMGCVVAVVS